MASSDWYSSLMTQSPQSVSADDAIQGELFSFSLSADYARGYRGSVAIKVAGITYRQLDYWARKSIVEPSIHPSNGSGSRRLYSFKDIAIMAVAKRLLDAGVNLVNVTTAIIFLNRHSIERLKQMTIICDGQTVQECDDNQENMRRMLASGLAVFAIAVGHIVARVEEDLTLETAAYDTTSQIESHADQQSLKLLQSQTRSSDTWNLVQETWG